TLCQASRNLPMIALSNVERTKSRPDITGAGRAARSASRLAAGTCVNTRGKVLKGKAWASEGTKHRTIKATRVTRIITSPTAEAGGRRLPPRCAVAIRSQFKSHARFAGTTLG